MSRGHALIFLIVLQVSFIAALFSKDSASDVKEASAPSEDFLFALFIAQEDSKGMVNEGAPAKDGRKVVPALPVNKHPKDVRQAGNEEQQLLGHFCAPFVEGFCQANYCILHNPAVQE